ncbi:hypothetical protein DFH28DRAFT_1092481 [Melampsora americana]|nr:hypothetical protein DFH28DRAFT_1092481 [Melampsora americana]
MAPPTTRIHTHPSIQSTKLNSHLSNQSQKPITRHPTTVPLPPSPPATETLNLEDALPEPIQRSRSRRSKNASNKLNLSLNNPSHPPQTTLSKLPIKRSLQDHLTGSDHPSIELASPISSPLNSPTNRKAHPHKRTKVNHPHPHQSSSSVIEEPIESASIEFRDSPKNPFLVKKGESGRQPGQFHDEKSRKLVYVFRGKRIQYDPGEDLHNTGDSPFTLSTPKLLFPTRSVKSPSPPPSLQLEFNLNNEERSMIKEGFQTPLQQSKMKEKTMKFKNEGLPPTPESKSKSIHHHHPLPVTVPEGLIRSNENSLIGGKQNLSKGMR